MRKRFAELVSNEMQSNSDIYIITADLGYKMWDQIKDKYKNRFYNVGSAEQLMMGICIGLAENKKIPMAYSITPFLICRPFELIRNYINEEKTPVKLIGSGRNQDYSHDGFSHFAGDDLKILNCFPNIKIYTPDTKEELEIIFHEFLYNQTPSYLNLRR